MAELRDQVDVEDPQAHIPLLESNHNQSSQPTEGEDDEEAHLDCALKLFDTLLGFLGFHQSSILSCALSWSGFVLVGIVLPVVVLQLSDCAACEKYQIKDFELDVVASQACLAAVSLLCLSHNLRKYGIKRFLSVDRQSTSLARFRKDYVKKIRGSIRLLVFWALPCFILKTVREISHRFRIFLLLEFLVVSASQFMTLLQTTRYTTRITLINGGDFAVSAIVQAVAVILCFHGATKISHRAEGIASVASRWHALVTCGPDDASQPQYSNGNGNGNLESPNRLKSITCTYSESDLESLDIVTMPTTTQLASYMSSYHKREAFVLYLQMNPGGITIFGWTVNRALLLNTILCLELTLVTFVLGKTLVFN